MSERLEEIKRAAIKSHDTLRTGETLLDDDEIIWLIQQAELYELTSSPISHKLAKLNKFIQERHFGDWGHSTIDISMDLILVLEERNNRYKQALEFYADGANYVAYETSADGLPEIDNDQGETARQALEGESE